MKWKTLIPSDPADDCMPGPLVDGRLALSLKNQALTAIMGVRGS